MRRLSFAVLLATLTAAAHANPHAGEHHGGAHRHASPYAGETGRDIKALSAQEQKAWLEGQGQGLARAAELNGYPGPMHVLELAEPLRLDESQRTRTRALMDRHKAQVRELGAQLVAAERQLDQAFREQKVSAAEVDRLTADIARLQGEVRASHLRTHLEQTAMLTSEQVAAYGRLRGYRP